MGRNAARCDVEGVEEWVESDDEEERGDGVPLRHASANVDGLCVAEFRSQTGRRCFQYVDD